MEMIKIGTIVNTFGIKGECKVKAHTDFIFERFKKGAKVYIQFEAETLPVTIAQVKEHKGMLLIQFDKWNNINDVEKYKGCEILISKDQQHALKKGEFYFYELEGMIVFDQKYNKIGIVKQVEESHAHNNLRVIKEDGNSCLIPFIPAFIMGVDKEKKEITVNVIEGLL